MEEEGKFRVKKFNCQNYQLWKMQMEDYLYQKCLFLLLGRKTKQSTTIKDEEWEVLDIKALGTILLWLASSMAFNIFKEKTTEAVMSALDKLNEKPLDLLAYFRLTRVQIPCSSTNIKVSA